MVIQILDHITDEIKQIRVDVFYEGTRFEDEFDEIDETAKFVLLSIDGKSAGTSIFSKRRSWRCTYWAHGSTQDVSWTASRD